MSYHGISVKYHKPDMAMIAHIKNHIHISTRYVNDFIPITNGFLKSMSLKHQQNIVILSAT